MPQKKTTKKPGGRAPSPRPSLPPLVDVPAEPTPPSYRGASPGQELHPFGRPGALPRPPVLTPRRAAELARAVRVIGGAP